MSVRLQNAATGETLATLADTGTELKLDELTARAGAALRDKLQVPSISPAESLALQASIPATSEARKHFYQGVESLQKFDFVGAREQLQKALAADPNFAPAHASLAQAWIGMGYDDRAREEAQKAFELSKHLPREDQLLVEARYREIAADWDKAVNAYQSLSIVFPDNPEYSLRTVDVLTRAGRGKEALQKIQELRTQGSPLAKDPRLDLKEAEADASLGDMAKQKEAAMRAAAQAKERGARLLEAEALWRTCEAMLNLGDAANAEPVCRQSINIAQPLNDFMRVARGLTILGRADEAQGHLDQALAAHRQALEYVRKIGSRRDVAGALTNIGMVLSDQGNHAAAVKSYQEGLAEAREIHDQGQVLNLLNNLAIENETIGNFPAALRLYQQSLETARAVQDKAGIGRALSNIGSVESLQGNFPAALQNFQDALKNAEETGLKSDKVQILYARGDAKLALGDLAGAEADYNSGHSLAAEINDKLSIALGQVSLGNLRLLQGKAEEALALATQAANEFHNQGQKDLESQARVLIASCLLELNKAADAAKEVQTAQELAPQDLATKLAAAITASRVEFRAGKQSEAKKGLEAALVEAKRLGMPGMQFEARLAEGEMGLFGGDRRAALAVLTSLQQEASRKGFKQYEIRGKALARKVQGAKAG